MNADAASWYNEGVDVTSSHRALLAQVDSALDADVATILHSRLATLFGATASPANGPVADFVDQYVVDAHGVTDELCARLIAEIGEDQATALTFAVAVHEAEARRAAVLR